MFIDYMGKTFKTKSQLKIRIFNLKKKQIPVQASLPFHQNIAMGKCFSPINISL